MNVGDDDGKYRVPMNDDDRDGKLKMNTEADTNEGVCTTWLVLASTTM